MAKSLHQLIGPANVKKSKSKKKKVKKEVTTLEKQELTKPTFVWTKIALTTAPVFGIPISTGSSF